MSAATLRQAAALMRERETEPWPLAVADLLESQARLCDWAEQYTEFLSMPWPTNHVKKAFVVADAYIRAVSRSRSLP